MVQDLHWEDSWAILLVIPVPVNYAVRFSGPVTALTARRVRYGVGPDLICQPGPSPGTYKDALVPRRFSSNSLPPLFLHPPTRSCLRPPPAPFTPCGSPPPFPSTS